ncbi:MAG: hypothetical protein HYZ53_01295 [Planctomycetes bacterium]|nr:hypothetical protein [Planctomycetota bacterium]
MGGVFVPGGAIVAESTIDLNDAETKIEKILMLLAEGTEVILTRGRQPVARVVPIDSTAGARTPGLHPGAMMPSPDFDDPLSEEVWTGSS